MNTYRHAGADPNNINPRALIEIDHMNLSEPHSNMLPDCCSLGYGSAPVISFDSCCGLPIPPPYSPLPLTMNQWPSMLAKQPDSYDSSLPHISSSPTQVPRIHSPLKSSTGGTTSRRTLTDEERQEICLYHEEHKSAKQRDIGGKLEHAYSNMYVEKCNSKLTKRI